MKFTSMQNGIITKAFNTYGEAERYFGSDAKIIPILSLKDWGMLPDDYKTRINGKPHVMYWGKNGTTFGPCEVVHDYPWQGE